RQLPSFPTRRSSDLRGLQVLRALNEHNYTTVLQLSKATGLPRATIYRLLDTLIAAGYVAQGGTKDLYRLTIMVRALSDGFDDERSEEHTSELQSREN